MTARRSHGDHQRQAVPVDQRVRLRRQPPARAPDRMVVGFVPAAGRVLVIRPRPPCLMSASLRRPRQRRRVLVDPRDRGVDRDAPVDLPCGVGLRLQHAQDLVPGAVHAEPVLPLPRVCHGPNSAGRSPPRQQPMVAHRPAQSLPPAAAAPARSEPTSRVRGHVKVPVGGRVEVPAGGQVKVSTSCSSCPTGA